MFLPYPRSPLATQKTWGDLRALICREGLGCVGLCSHANSWWWKVVAVTRTRVIFLRWKESLDTQVLVGDGQEPAKWLDGVTSSEGWLRWRSVDHRLRDGLEDIQAVLHNFSMPVHTILNYIVQVCHCRDRGFTEYKIILSCSSEKYLQFCAWH